MTATLGKPYQKAAFYMDIFEKWQKYNELFIADTQFIVPKKSMNAFGYMVLMERSDFMLMLVVDGEKQEQLLQVV